MASTYSFTLHSLNVRGLRDTKKRRSMFHWLRKFHNGVVFLQESHSCLEDEKFWKNEWGANIIFSHGSRDSKGTAILFPNTINCNIQNSICDPDGRFIILKTEIDNEQFTFINLYAPTKDHVPEQAPFYLLY